MFLRPKKTGANELHDVAERPARKDLDWREGSQLDATLHRTSTLHSASAPASRAHSLAPRALLHACVPRRAWLLLLQHVLRRGLPCAEHLPTGPYAQVATLNRGDVSRQSPSRVTLLSRSFSHTSRAASRSCEVKLTPWVSMRGGLARSKLVHGTVMPSHTWLDDFLTRVYSTPCRRRKRQRHDRWPGACPCHTLQETWPRRHAIPPASTPGQDRATSQIEEGWRGGLDLREWDESYATLETALCEKQHARLLVVDNYLVSKRHRRRHVSDQNSLRWHALPRGARDLGVEIGLCTAPDAAFLPPKPRAPLRERSRAHAGSMRLSL
eukprot:scaffold35269_cov34-Tisochrysis_lutea.AAC.3